jgi:hypothetical protein
MCASDKVWARGSGSAIIPGDLSPPPAKRKRSHRKHVHAEAQERGPALHTPRRRTLRHISRGNRESSWLGEPRAC